MSVFCMSDEVQEALRRLARGSRDFSYAAAAELKRSGYASEGEDCGETIINENGKIAAGKLFAEDNRNVVADSRPSLDLTTVGC